MPIPIEELKKLDKELDLEVKQLKEKFKEVLESSPGMAFSSKEIAERLGLPPLHINLYPGYFMVLSLNMPGVKYCLRGDECYFWIK